MSIYFTPTFIPEFSENEGNFDIVLLFFGKNRGEILRGSCVHALYLVQRA